MGTNEILLGVEAGGTTFVVSVSSADDPSNILQSWEVPTEDPKETISAIAGILESSDLIRNSAIKACGIASFGPVDVNPASKTYGEILDTPKRRWAHFNILSAVSGILPKGTPVAIETDVNAAALGIGEHLGIQNVAYVTAGTGIGVGAYVNGGCIHGSLHPELGHLPVEKCQADKEANYIGVCPFHKNCLEGYVCASAIAKRLNVPPAALASVPDNDPVWDTVSEYFSTLTSTIVLAYSPEIIVLGGGIFRRSSLIGRIGKMTQNQIGNYIKTKEMRDIHRYIVGSLFGGRDGAVGSLYLARRAAAAVDLL